VLLEDLVGARMRYFFLVQLLYRGGLLEDLVDARVRDLFLAQLLSWGRCVKTSSVRVSGIFFVFIYFLGVAA
jgi:hypothetical protein